MGSLQTLKHSCSKNDWSWITSLEGSTPTWVPSPWGSQGNVIGRWVSWLVVFRILQNEVLHFIRGIQNLFLVYIERVPFPYRKWSVHHFFIGTGLDWTVIGIKNPDRWWELIPIRKNKRRDREEIEKHCSSGKTVNDGYRILSTKTFTELFLLG